MNLESDKRLNIQLRLDFSSAPTGEARQAGREDIESLSAVHEPERPANTCSKRVSATSRTAVYGAVRTVVWEGRSCEAPPYPDRSDFVHWPIAPESADCLFVGCEGYTGPNRDATKQSRLIRSGCWLPLVANSAQETHLLHNKQHSGYK